MFMILTTEIGLQQVLKPLHLRYAQHIGLDRLWSHLPLVVLDEIHKFAKWKQLVKGFGKMGSNKTKKVANHAMIKYSVLISLSSPSYR